MTIYKSFRILGMLAAALAVSILAGCASPASRESMSLPSFVTKQQFNKTVNVLVSGGSDTGAMESTNVSDQEFQAAIEDAINKSKLFKEVVSSNPDLNLEVNISSLSKPSFGFTFEVQMETGWVLSRKSDNSVLMKKSIKSTGKATTSDAIVAVTRIRMAVERAAQDNIAQGLNAIAALNSKAIQ